MRKTLALLALLPSLAAAGTFVSDSTSTLPGPKVDLRPVPVGANPNNYQSAADYNALRSASLDLRAWAYAPWVAQSAPFCMDGSTCSATLKFDGTNLVASKPVSGDLSPSTVLATGSTTARSLKDIAADLTNSAGLRQRSYSALTFIPPGPACWLNVQGTKGEVGTVSRAGANATVLMSGVESTCTANLLRVTDVPVLGALIEPTRTQYLTTPDSPPTQTVSVPTGAASTIAWMEGTGSATLTATGGTATTTGLPCTITATSDCLFSVSGTGSASVTFTPSGSVTFAQVEWGGQNPGFRSSKIHVGGSTRNADVVSFVNPISTTPSCVCVTATSPSTRPWATTVGSLWTSGVVASANTARIYLGGNNYLYYDTYDATATLKRLSIDITNWADGSTHDVCACLEAGCTQSWWLDGFWQDSVSTGAGACTTNGTPLYVGGQSNGQNTFGGVVSSVRVTSAVNPGVIGPTRLQPYQVIAFGDSISSYGSPPYVTTLATLLGPKWKGSRYAYPGEWSTNLLWQWYPARASGAQYVVILAGINDINQGYAGANGVNAIASLKEMYDSARSAGMTVIPVTILPAGGQAFWTSAHEALRTAINTWIRSYAKTYGLKVADAAPLFDDGTGKLLAIYDSGDHLHPNQAGYDYLASIVRTSFP